MVTDVTVRGGAVSLSTVICMLLIVTFWVPDCPASMFPKSIGGGMFTKSGPNCTLLVLVSTRPRGDEPAGEVAGWRCVADVGEPIASGELDELSAEAAVPLVDGISL